MGAIDDLGKRLLDEGIDRWHSRTGLVAVVVATIVLGVAIFAGINIANITKIEWALIGAVVLGVCVVWWKTNIERVSKGRVGFGVAIYFEDADQTQQLRSDFVVTLRNLLNGSRLRHRFQFIEFPQSIAKRIVDADDSKRLASRSGVHFLIHGRARLRAIPKGQSHVIDLSWLVRHAMIETKQSEQFADDARAVFPSRIIIQPQGNMFVCEFAAQQVDAVARYVIGTAAALSRDFIYAEELLLDAEAKFAAHVAQANGTQLSVLLDKARKRIVELYETWLTELANRFTAKRDRKTLEECERIVPKLRKYAPDSYSARLIAGMAAFLLRRDFTTARLEIDGCRGEDDAAWMYSDAFLSAYKGDLESAYKAYRKAFQSPIADETLPTQCEEFIQVVIDDEPDRPWLYYCLGLINFRAKGDLVAARADFQRFVESADPAAFKKQIDIARKWMQEIDTALRA